MVKCDLIKIYLKFKSIFQSLYLTIYDSLFFRNDPKNKNRKYQTFKENDWQTQICEKLREKGVPCGFAFQTHKIYTTSNTATFHGYCKCGSILRGEILSLETSVIRVNCFVTPGNGQCGKRQLRANQREKVTEHLLETGKFKMKYNFN